MTSRKTIRIVAGPNGSGKSTFAESFLLQKHKNENFINPDLIAAALSPLNTEQAAFQAGQVSNHHLLSFFGSRSRKYQAHQKARGDERALHPAGDGSQTISKIFFKFLDYLQTTLQRLVCFQ